MYQSIERPITASDRERILGCMVPPHSPFREHRFRRTVITEIAGWLIAAVIAIWIKRLSATFVIPAALAFYIIWWLFHIKGRIFKPLAEYRAANEQFHNLQNAIESAEFVRVHRVEASAVVQVLHDDGTICLFDLGDNRTYWIDPQNEMMPGRPLPDAWPNTEFEVLEIPGRKEQYGPFCSGKRLKPQQSLEFDDYFQEFDFDKFPADGVINKSLESFLAGARA